jgi:maltose alpha-D-glucosyltransferase/alpha-amylase
MLRSFNYAALTALRTRDFRAEDAARMANAASCWGFWVSLVFLQDYVEVGRGGGFLPASKQELKTVLDLYLLQKAVYELNYELNNRPEWVAVPIRGILQLMGAA